jgi:hypothetical protein
MECVGELLRGELAASPSASFFNSLFPPALAVNILGHVDIRVTQVVAQKLTSCALAHDWKYMVGKLSQCLERGLRSVRTSAKAACQHSPRAN